MDIQNISNQEKHDIIKRINNISNRKNKKKYYIQLFNIINSNNIKYTNNLNGVFFNLNNLNNNIIYEIKKFLDNIENKIDSESETVTTDI